MCKKIKVFFYLFLFISNIVIAQQVSFENKVTSNLFDMYGGGSNFQFAFDGIYDEVSMLVDYNRLYGGIQGKFGLSRLNFDGSTEQWGLSWVNDAAQMFRYGGYDWFIEYEARPGKTVIFSDDVYTYGSYLPVFNGNLESGNLGSDFGLLLKEDGLCIGIGVDFGLGSRTTQTSLVSGVSAGVSSVSGSNDAVLSKLSTTGSAGDVMVGNTALYSSKKVSDVVFDVNLLDLSKLPGFNFGVEYNYEDMFTVGLTARNLLSAVKGFTTKFVSGGIGNSESVAASLNFALIGIENMLLTAGFYINDDGVLSDYMVVDGTLFSTGFLVSSERMELAADFVCAWISTMLLPSKMCNNYSGYDTYIALRASYLASEHWKAELIIRGTASLGKGYATFFEANPNLQYVLNEHNSFSVGLDVISTSGYYNICIPCYWSYRM